MTPDPWELTGKPGDVMLRCGASVNVFARQEDDITIGDLTLADWSGKRGCLYDVRPVEHGVCVTLSLGAGDRITVQRHESNRPIEGWSCVECHVFKAGASIELATAVCYCGVGRGRWGAAMRPVPDPVEAFYAKVNARAEASMLAGHTVTGAHHRSLEAEITAYRLAGQVPGKDE
jgi:hypothetical protein